MKIIQRESASKNSSTNSVLVFLYSSIHFLKDSFSAPRLLWSITVEAALEYLNMSFDRVFGENFKHSSAARRHI